MNNNEISMQIFTLKEDLKRYKEDVEQVELFGMQRTDYEEKKLMCKSIILELRELEQQLRWICKAFTIQMEIC